MQHRANQLFAQAEPAAPVAQEPDLMMLLRIVIRGWRVMAAALGLAVVFGAVFAYGIAKPRFAATATLAIEARGARVVDLQSVVSGMATDDASINTELEIIRSRGVLEKLVQRMGLTEDPEFNPTLAPRGWGRIAGRTAEPAPEAAQLLATTRRLRGVIGVFAPRNTFLIEISARASEPAKAAAIANALAELYIAEQIAVKFNATENAVSWISDRVAALETEIAAKEAAIKDLRSGAGLLDAADLEARGVQLREIRLRLAEARASRTRLAGAIAKAETAMEAGDFATVATALAEPSLHLLLPRLQDGGASAAQFTSQAAQTLNRRRAEAVRAGAQATALAATEAELLDKIGAQSADLTVLQQLQRELDATRVLNESFLARLKEISVQRGLNQADARILSAAAPGDRIAPRRGLIVVLSALAGALVGMSVLFARHFLHSGYRTAEELERDTGLRVLGQVPRLPIAAPTDLAAFLRDKSGSAPVEAIRDLRTSVMLSDVDNPPKVIVIASALPGEGKTTLAISLAHSLSGLGRRVLLIEGDIRHRTLPRYLGRNSDGGLLSVLRDGCELAQAVVAVPELGADVLMGEDRPGLNAADIFASQRFAALIARARESYDFVLIDTPPVAVVADARVIARAADAVLQVVAWNRTSRTKLHETLRQFASTRGGVTGLVLAQVDPVRMRRYGLETRYGGHAAEASYYSG